MKNTLPYGYIFDDSTGLMWFNEGPSSLLNGKGLPETLLAPKLVSMIEDTLPSCPHKFDVKKYIRDDYPEPKVPEGFEDNDHVKLFLPKYDRVPENHVTFIDVGEDIRKTEVVLKLAQIMCPVGNTPPTSFRGISSNTANVLKRITSHTTMARPVITGFDAMNTKHMDTFSDLIPELLKVPNLIICYKGFLPQYGYGSKAVFIPRMSEEFVELVSDIEVEELRTFGKQFVYVELQRDYKKIYSKTEPT